MSQAGGQLTLNVVKPDGNVLSLDVDEVIIPAVRGFFGVRPGHAPFLAELGLGEVTYRVGATHGYLAIEGGFCEVRPDRVTVLAEKAEKAEDIDVARATRARTKAMEHLTSLLTKQGSGDEIELVRRKLDRAEVRLRVTQKRSPQSKH